MVEEKEIKTIVVVDDEYDIVIGIRGILMAAGYEVIEAYNGLSALNVIKDSHPNLIISDVLMPKMNGFELVDQLKRNKMTHDIPVILLTQKDTFDDIHRGYELGAINYLPKPFDRNTLLEAVEFALASDLV